VKKTLAVLGTAALGVSMLAMPAFAAHEGTGYSGSLNALNDSGASGSANIQVSEDGDSMTVEYSASGLAELNDGEGNMLGHAAHIHGIFDGDLSDDPGDGSFSASSCPTDSADQDGDGIVSVAEGAPAYGGIQVSLTTEGDTSPDSGLDVARFEAGSSVEYEREIEIPSALKDELGKVHIVVHGIDADGSGDLTDDQDRKSSLDDSLPIDATAPALCGTLAASSTGAVQTGGGGTATDTGTDSALVLGLGGLALAGAVALRRRGEAA
jgi:hypothetical protein